MEKLEYSIDNEKYKGKGKQRVLITNMESATDCTGKKLGTCQLNGKNAKCYAECAEVQYPSVLPYRRRQEKQWENHSGWWFSQKIQGIQSRARKKITHHRLNESGEIKGLKCVNKAMEISRENEKIGIKTFIYTSRERLWSQLKTAITLGSPLVVNGSGFMAHNEYRVVPEGYVAKKGEYWCPDKCYNCRMCKERLGITILSKARHTVKAK